MSKIFVYLFPLAYIFFSLKTPPFGTIDQFVIVIAAYLIFCKNIVNTENVNIKFDFKILILYFLYCAFSFITILNNPSSELSSIFHTFTILVKPIIAIVVVFAITSFEDLRYCIWSMVLFLIIILLAALYLAYASGNLFFLRYFVVQGGILQPTVFNNPNVMTRAIILLVPIIYVFSFYLQNKYLAWSLRFLCLLSFLLPIMGISRATMVSMTVVYMAMFWRMRQKYLILFPIMALIFSLTFSQVHERVVEVVEHGYAVGHREKTAEASIKSIKENPLLGTGIRSGQETLEKHGGPKIGFEKRITMLEHNIILNVLLENGIIGLILLLSFLFFYAKYLFDNIRKARNTMVKNLLFGSLMGFCGFLLTTLTGGSINENILWYQVGITLTIIKLSAAQPVVKMHQLAAVPHLIPRLRHIFHRQL